MNNTVLICGNTNKALAASVAKSLNMPLADAKIDRFNDGEVNVDIHENVRGKDIFIIQSTCYPVNDSLMEILLIADALKRASAGSITAVIPYYGYARQDRRPRSKRVPISAKLKADLIMVAGIGRIITVDLHADQIQGFFNIPADNIYYSRIISDDILKSGHERCAIISPDVGGVVRARAVVKKIENSHLVIVDKRRQAPNKAEVMNIIGDVKDLDCIIIDDIIDTAGTLTQAAKALKQAGAKRIFAYCTHPVLSDPALDLIESSEIDYITVSDSIPLTAKAEKSTKIKVLPLGDLLAETIKRVIGHQSVSAMF
ncbi:MAG: ribose-phosphate pyrophosphokinase [Legionellales bacterium]|nr:ribose-phosphate pyrophosphokinase [Legionellales bacterium]OUX66123.1 MAG: ribose-phosphate pyrophosphokinase [Gammaproteobacteria bacterium TMED281]